MSIRDLTKKVIEQFRGAQVTSPTGSGPDETGVALGFARLARNIIFPFGKLVSREGFGPVAATTGAVTSMFWFYAANVTKLVYYAGSTLYALDITTLGNPSPTVVTLYSLAGYAATVAQANLFYYAAIYTSSIVAAGQARVGSAGAWVDKCFSGPLASVSLSATDSGTGISTKGQKHFGIVGVSRSGFTGHPSPASAPGFANFQPYSFTSAGNKSITITASATWPADWVAVWFIMATTANLSDYVFLPGSKSAVSGGSAGSVSFTINLDDGSLRGQVAQGTADSANENFNLLTQDSSGNGPFNVLAVCPYNLRMVYLGDGTNGPTIYVSDKLNFQHITGDQHVLQLPGQLPQTAACEGPNTILYVFGPTYTYLFSDNSDVPVTWAAPQLVSGAIGAPNPKAVTRSEHGWIWVASEAGLQALNGSQYYPQPISYYQTADWNRINWAAANAIQVLDNPVAKRVYVYVPLDGAPACNYLLMWDYQNAQGLPTASTVNYSGPDYIQITNYPGISAACMVRSESTKQLEEWVAPYGASHILRRDPTLHTDTDGTTTYAIDTIYETGPILGSSDRLGLARLSFVRFRVRGNGNVQFTVKTLDGKYQHVLPLIPLSGIDQNNNLIVGPGQWVHRFVELPANENFTVRMDINSTGGSGNWVEWSGLEIGYSQNITHR